MFRQDDGKRGGEKPDPNELMISPHLCTLSSIPKLNSC